MSRTVMHCQVKFLSIRFKADSINALICDASDKPCVLIHNASNTTMYHLGSAKLLNVVLQYCEVQCTHKMYCEEQKNIQDLDSNLLHSVVTYWESVSGC